DDDGFRSELPICRTRNKLPILFDDVFTCCVGGNIRIECICLFYQLVCNLIAGICGHSPDIPDEFLSVNIEFAAWLLVVFYQFDRHPAETCVKGGGETGGAAADNERVISFHIYFPLYDCNFIYYVLL